MKQKAGAFRRQLAAALIFCVLLSGMVPFTEIFALAANVLVVDKSPKSGKIYAIRQVSSGKFMDASGPNKYVNDGHSVILSDMNDVNSAKWQLIAEDNTYHIVSSFFELYLNVLQANYSINQPVDARKKNLDVTQAQKFRLSAVGNGSFRLETTGVFSSALCIGYDGKELVLQPLSDNPDCLWEFVSLEKMDGVVNYNYAYNGGNSADVNNFSVPEGAPVNLSVQAYKTDAEFLGWNTNRNATTTMTSLTMGAETSFYMLFSSKL